MMVSILSMACVSDDADYHVGVGCRGCGASQDVDDDVKCHAAGRGACRGGVVDAVVEAVGRVGGVVAVARLGGCEDAPGGGDVDARGEVVRRWL